MKDWIWLIAWTVVMYVTWLYLYRSWKARQRQRQTYLWQQVGFHPDLNYQAGKLGIAIDKATHRIALRDANNLGVFEPGDIVNFEKGALAADGASRHTLALRIRDPRKRDWQVVFQEARDRDAFYAELCSIMPDKEGPGTG